MAWESSAVIKGLSSSIGNPKLSRATVSRRASAKLLKYQYSFEARQAGTIREGHRVKVYLSDDLLLPAYQNHRMPRDL